MKRNRADGPRCRAGFAVIGMVVFAVGGAAPSAPAQTQEWYDREYQAGVFGVDDAVDIAYWRDQETGEEWVYVAGYHTLANGATVFATSRYAPSHTGPGENDPLIVHYPLLNTNPTGTNRAVAIEVDYEGNVYVTGESTDPTGADGQDIVIIKYDKNLDPDGDWVLAGHQDAVVRWDNPFVAGPLSDDRPVGLSLAADYTPGQAEPNAIAITGTTYVGALVGRDDIVTMLFDVNTGNVYPGFGGGGAVYKAGTANSDDSPVGMSRTGG